jgi:hypothetical protein
MRVRLASRAARLRIIVLINSKGLIKPAKSASRRRRCALRWSTNMVHSTVTRPPRLDQKALQAKGF